MIRAVVVLMIGVAMRCAFATEALYASTPSDFALNALSCARAIVPALDELVPRGWAAEHPFPVSVGPWDSRCSNGLAAFAQSEHCHNLTDMGTVDARGLIADSWGKALAEVCDDSLHVTYERVIKCLSVRPQTLTTRDGSAQQQRVFCTLLGSCGFEQVMSTCRALVLPTVRFLRETCSDEGLRWRKRSCAAQWAQDANTLERTHRLSSGNGPVTAGQESKQRLTLVATLKESLSLSPNDWDWWLQQIDDAAATMTTVEELEEYHRDTSGGNQNLTFTATVQQLSALYSL